MKGQKTSSRVSKTLLPHQLPAQEESIPSFEELLSQFHPDDKEDLKKFFEQESQDNSPSAGSSLSKPNNSLHHYLTASQFSTMKNFETSGTDIRSFSVHVGLSSRKAFQPLKAFHSSGVPHYRYGLDEFSASGCCHQSCYTTTTAQNFHQPAQTPAVNTVFSNPIGFTYDTTIR